MIGTIKSTIKERLYLSKEENREVFLNNCELLHQHQVEGLRFLFSQFYKKKPGVIVNYPSGCGKTVLVVLFLQAVRNFLNIPVLILCMQDEEMSYWKNNFLQWTEYTDDDIVIESTNPYVKKKQVFIKKTIDINSYLRRSWSVVIVKNDSVGKDAKLIFDADFKMWLTSTDMMKDLSMLSFIYTWINPKAKINIEEFKPVNNSIKERLKKLILLESFLESVILRRNDMMAIVTQNKEYEKSMPPKTSRKNKDFTGTKIKRSKIKRNDDATISQAKNTTATSDTYDIFSSTPFDEMKDEIQVNLNKKNELNLNKDNSFTKLDIDESIPNKSCIERNEMYQSSHHDILDNENEENESQSLMNFDSALRDIIECENINITQDYTATTSNESKEMAELGDEILSQNKISLKDNEIDINNGLNNLSEDILEVGTNINSLINVDSFGNKTLCKEVLNDVKVCEDITPELYNSDDIGKEIELTKLNTSKIEKNEYNSNLNAATSENKTVSGIKIESSDNKHKDIDAKLKELEESTLMQFKGSILDSIF